MVFRNPFRTPLPASLMSGAPAPEGHEGEMWVIPADVDLDHETYPEAHEEGVRFGRDLDQEQNPAYAGEAHLNFYQERSFTPDTAELHNDLRYQRYDGAVPGAPRVIASEGPVTGGSNGGKNWTGTVEQLYRSNPQFPGPVRGGSDQGASIANAWYASQAEVISEAQASAALVAAV